MSDGERAGARSFAPAEGVEALSEEVRRLRELLEVAESAIVTLRDRHEDAEEGKAHLARLAVASAQLHDSCEEAECLHNLQDVLLNLVGTEQIGVWSLSADGRTLELRASQGIKTEPWQQVHVSAGPLGRAVTTKEIVVPGETASGEPTVCIPLMLGERVLGVVAVFRLLPHRSGLGPQDDDVFRLVRRQAAFALHSAGAPWLTIGKVGDG
jgi:GAF domain-containing protein